MQLLDAAQHDLFLILFLCCIIINIHVKHNQAERIPNLISALK